MAFTKINAAGIGTTETVTVDGLTVINDGSFGGNLTVSGVLTYEDVTNVDSVGLITARNGIVVGSGITLSKDGDIFATGITTVSGNVKVGTGITLSPDGDVFFTGIATGNGSGLTALNASNISSGTVPTARLGSGTASSSTFLRGDSTFQTVNTDLVSDTSPQLGGNLDVNTKNILFGDSGGSTDDRLTFGAGTDLSIYHDGTYSNIYNNTATTLRIINGGNAGMLIQNQNSYNIEIKTNAEDAIKCVANGAVELYHNNAVKLATTASGIDITGNCTITGNFRGNDNVKLNLGNGDDLQIYHDGSNSYLVNTTGFLKIKDESNVRIDTDAFAVNSGDNSEAMIVATKNGAVELYNDNVKKFNTQSGGVQFYGSLYGDDNNKIELGNDQDLKIYHDGSNSRIKDTGTGSLKLSGNVVAIENSGTTETMATFTENGAVRLYYDNTEYASTLNSGFNVGLKARNSDYNHLTTVGWALSDGWTKVVFDNSVGANTPLTIYNSNTNFNRYMVYFMFNGGIANYQSNDINLCDERVKKDFADVSSQWDNIKNIGLKHFRYQEDSSSDPLKIGVVAQQVETVYPDLVEDSWPQGDANPNTGEGTFYKSVKEEQFLMYAVKALQEAQTRIETLEAKVAALEG